MTLIELIEASYAVFERYGIEPPDDAAYHRYLLSLSIDPEPDWHKKIRAFTVHDQQRIQQRLRSVDTASDASFRAPRASQSPAHAASRERARSASDRRSSLSSVTPRSASDRYEHDRQRQQQARKRASSSLAGDDGAVTPMPARASPQRRIEVLVSLASPRHHRKQRDQFSDMLSLTPSSSRRRLSVSSVHASSEGQRPELKESVVRNAVATTSETPSDAEQHMSSARSSPLAKRRTESAAHTSQRRDQVDDSRALDPAVSSHVDAAPMTLSARTTSAPSPLQATFASWKARHSTHEFVSRPTHDRMLPICTRALFRWIVRTLPPTRSFATESSALPTAVLARVALRAPESVATLSVLTRRLARWTLQSIVQSWRADTLAKQRFRVLVRIRRRTETLDTAFTCLRYWALFTEARKCVHVKCAWITQRYGRSLLRASLQHWTACLHVAQRTHEAAQWHARRLVYRVFNAWTHSVASDRTVLQLVTLATARRAVRLWRRHALQMRDVRSARYTAQCHYASVVLGRHWREWRGHTLRKQSLALTLAHWQRKRSLGRLKTAFIGWQCVSQRCQAQQSLVSQCQARSAARQQRQAFVEWATWCEHKCTRALMIATALAQHDSKLAAAVLRTWQLHVTQALQQEAAVVRSIQRTQQRTLWRTWRRATQMQRTVRMLQRELARFWMQQCLRSWRCVTQRKLATVVRLALSQRTCETRALRLCWHALLDHMLVKRAQHSAAESLIARKARVCASSHWRRWQELVRAKRACQRSAVCVAQHVVRTAALTRSWIAWRCAFAHLQQMRALDNLADALHRRRCFRVWHQRWRTKQRQRAQLALATESLAHRRTMRILTSWRRVARAARALVAAAQRCKTRHSTQLVAVSWRTWRCAFARTRQQQTQVASVLLHWQHAHVARCFLRWKTRSSVRRAHRRLLASLCASSNGKRLETSFFALKQHWRTVREQHAALHNAQAALLVSRARRAVAAWRQYARTRRALARTLRSLRQQQQSMTLRQLFDRWKLRHNSIKRVQMLLKHSARTALATALQKWRTWRQCRVLARCRYRDIEQHMQQLRLRAAVERLRAHARATKGRTRMHCALARMRHHNAQAATFSAWTQFIARQQQRRRQHRSQVHSLQLWKLQRLLAHWQQRLQKRKRIVRALARATAFALTASLSTLFAAWRRFVTQRRFVQSLTQRALVFRVFTLLPRSFGHWQRFVSARKRKQTLRMRAAGLLCHQREARSFRTWTAFTADAKRARCAVTRWRQQAQLRCFTRWTMFQASCQQQRRDRERAVTLYSRHTSTKALAAWQRATRRTKLQQHVVQQWRSRTARMCFDAWHQRIIFEQQQRHSICVRFVHHCATQLRVTCWRRWRAVTTQRRCIKRLQLRQAFASSARMFQAWQAFVLRRQQLRQRSRDVALRAHMRMTHVCWTHWRSRLHLYNALERLRAVSLARQQRDCAERIVRQWRGYATRMRAVKRMVRTKQHAQLAMVLHSGWCTYVARKRAEKEQDAALAHVHRSFLADWLAHEVQTRTATVLYCEDVLRGRCERTLVLETWASWTRFHEHKRRQHIAVRQWATHMACSSTRSDSERVAQRLTHILTRWRVYPAARALGSWAYVAQQQCTARKHTLLALETWQATQTTRCFTHWRVTARRCKLERAARHLRLARCWRRWGVFQQAMRQTHALTVRASTWHRERACGRCLSTWHALTLRTRLHRTLVQQLYTLSCLKLVRALFQVWRRAAVALRTARVQTTVALALYEARRVRTCWRAWRTFVRAMQCHREELQRNTERLQVLLLCSVFRGWQSHVTRARIARLLSSKCDARTAARVIHAWHEHAHTVRTLQHTADTFERLQAWTRGVRALKHFAAAQRRTSAAHQRAKHFISLMRNQQVARVWRQWQHVALAARKTRRARAHYATRVLLPTVWRQWLRALACKRLDTSRVAQAARAWTHLLARKAWNALQMHHAIQKRKRERTLAADAQYHTIVLKRVVLRWRQRVVHALHVRAVGAKVLLQWRLRAVYRCFASWSRVAQCTRELQHRSQAVCATGSTLLVLRSWRVWRTLFAVARRNKQRRLQRSWSRWRAFCALRRALQSFKRMLETTSRTQTLRRLLHQWTQFVVACKMQRAVALLSTRFAATQTSKRAFKHWRSAVARTRTIKRQLRAVLLRMQCQQQFAVLRSWRAYVLTRQHYRGAVARTQERRALQLQLRCLGAWRQWVATTTRHRATLAHYVHILRFAVQRKTFAAWSAFTSARQALRAKTAMALVLRVQLSSRAVWTAWVAFTALQRQVHRAVQLCGRHVAARTLRQWRVFIVLHKVERMLGASNARCVEHSFVAWRTAAVLHRRVRALGATARETQWRAHLRACLSAWRHWSTLQKRIKRLLWSAASGHHTRFRFLLWLQYTQRCKRLKQLLLPSPLALAGDDALACAGDAEDVLSSGDQLQQLQDAGTDEDSKCDDRQTLARVAAALAVKARFFQRWELAWDVATCWQRWRLLFHARLFCRLRSLHRHLLAWQHWCVTRRRMRAVLQRMTHRRSAQSARTVLCAWRDSVQRVKQLQQERRRDRELWTIVSTEMARQERKCVKRHWFAWCAVVDRKRHLRTSLALYARARLVTKYWLVWTHDYLHSVRDARALAAQHTRHMHALYKRRAVQTLQRHAARCKRTRLVIEYFANRQFDTALPQILAHWRALVTSRKAAMDFAAALQSRTLERAFCLWRDWRRTQHTRKTRVLAMLAQRRDTQLASTWQSWQAFTARRRDKHAVNAMCLRHLVRTWLRTHWRQRVCDRKALTMRAARATRVLQAHRVRQVVQRWRVKSSDARLAKLARHFCLRKHVTRWRAHVTDAIVEQFYQKRLTTRMAALLRAWRRIAATRAYWRELCREHTLVQTTKHARICWRAWQQFVEQRHRSHDATQYRSHTLRSRTLSAWHAHVQRTVVTRELNLERAVCQYDHTLTRFVWTHWCAAIETQRTKRFSLLACMVKLVALTDSRMRDVVWRAWRQYMEQAQQCRAMQCSVLDRRLRKLLDAWRRRAAAQRQSRERKTHAAHYYANRLVSIAFFYWQNYALAWKRVSGDATEQQQQRLSTDAFASLALQRPVVTTDPRPVVVIARNDAGTNEVEVDDDDEDDKQQRRLPLSPVMKRMRQKRLDAIRADPNGAIATESLTFTVRSETSCAVCEVSLSLTPCAVLCSRASQTPQSSRLASRSGSSCSASGIRGRRHCSSH